MFEQILHVMPGFKAPFGQDKRVALKAASIAQPNTHKEANTENRQDPVVIIQLGRLVFPVGQQRE